MNLAALVVSFVLLVVFVRTESVGLQVLALLVMTACLRQAAAAASERDGRIFTLEQLR